MINCTDPIYMKWKDLNPTKKGEFYYAMNNADLAFIDPDVTSLENLEKMWEKFMNMTKPFRRRSDWIVLDFIGCTNEDLYNVIKSSALGDKLYRSDLVRPEDMISEAAFIPAADDIDFAQVLAPIIESPDFEDRVKEAEEWMMVTGFVLIIPIIQDFYGNSNRRITEEKWDFYNMLTRKHKRVSDWKSMELFGLTIPQIYTYLISMYNKENIENIQPTEIEDETPFTYSSFLRRYCCDTLMDESAKEFGEVMTKLMRPSDNFTESLHKAIVGDALDRYSSQNSLNVGVNYTDLPAFSPEEMIDMGIFNHAPESNYFGVAGEVLMPGDELLEWFKLYEAVYYGLPPTERYKELNRKRVQTLELAYNLGRFPNINNNALNQAIIEMGWNPVINFSPEVRVFVDRNMTNRINYYIGESKVTNLCGFEPLDIANPPIYEDTSVSPLRPIYLVFEEGFTAFSAVIKTYTKGIYSHAAISFDHTMERIYSYGVENTVIKSKGLKGGITHENIKSLNPEGHFGIYVIFVDNDIFEKIKTNVEYFVQNAQSTAYSYANILSILFKIPMERNNRMICSQFVDRMLKLGGIDITKKQSSLIDPNYLRNVSKANKRIYKVFEGKVKSFNAKTIEKRVNNLMSKSKAYTGYISESTMQRMTSYFNSSLEIIGELYTAIEPNDPLLPIYESVYKPCIEAEGICLERKEGFMFSSMRTLDNRNDTVDRGYNLIKEFNEATDDSIRATLLEGLKEMRSFIAREMVYVIRPALYEPLKECKLAIEDVLAANAANNK